MGINRGRYALADEILKTLERFDPSPNEVSEMWSAPTDGVYVRFEDVRDMLYRAVDDAQDHDR